jgi:hypothetical protein
VVAIGGDVMRECEVVEDGEKCTKKRHVKGMCVMHYQRFRRHGSTDNQTLRHTPDSVLTCRTCKRKLKAKDHYKVYEYERKRGGFERPAYCSKDCLMVPFNKRFRKGREQRDCSILRSHALTVADDPESLGAERIAEMLEIDCELPKIKSKEEIRAGLRREIAEADNADA